jgi:hypothetical protein
VLLIIFYSLCNATVDSNMAEPESIYYFLCWFYVHGTVNYRYVQKQGTHIPTIIVSPRIAVPMSSSLTKLKWYNGIGGFISGTRLIRVFAANLRQHR